jgi:hypothetical protein
MAEVENALLPREPRTILDFIESIDRLRDEYHRQEEILERLNEDEVVALLETRAAMADIDLELRRT